MKASQFFVSTLKEAPADAEVASHKRMTRAGMIKKLGTGICDDTPMGLRVIRKVENVLREEMYRAGAVEPTMPFVQPAELWEETGRFGKMGPALLRLKDRHGRDFVLQPTSEEAVTDTARREPRSDKQLPKNFPQIQTKFRDDRELIGVPQRMVISDRGLKAGQLEVQGRREDKDSSVAVADIVADVRARLAA